MFICGNDEAAKKTVAAILDQFGWETADMGSVEAARAIEPLCMLWCIPGFREATGGARVQAVAVGAPEAVDDGAAAAEDHVANSPPNGGGRHSRVSRTHDAGRGVCHGRTGARGLGEARTLRVRTTLPALADLEAIFNYHAVCAP